MSQSRRRRGRSTELILAEYLKQWWPYAEATSAAAPGTDIKGVIGVDWEVKARTGFPVKEAMKQTEKRHKDGVIAVHVLRQNGQGEAEIHNWPAVVSLSVLIELLKEAGY